MNWAPCTTHNKTGSAFAAVGRYGKPAQSVESYGASRQVSKRCEPGPADDTPVRNPKTLADLGDVRPEDFEIPDDIAAALEANADAWANWMDFTPAYRRIRASYVDRARNRGEGFEKRLRTLVERTEKGRQFGYRIEEFYTEG